ncbi:MAG TPA: hypothetical protein EYP76_05450 [Thiomicrorhabdus sp.]|nr:hypothetical protein [Thiomicrorhabdus sp.]
MNNKTTLNSLIISSVILFAGCQTPPQKSSPPPIEQSITESLKEGVLPLKHAYDFQILDSQTQTPLSVPQLAHALKEFDVVFIGEAHSNHASHLFEMQLMAELHALRPNQVLSLEMFNRNQQSILDRYLDGEVGEVYLIVKAPAWSNYVASYRPLVEYAKQHFIPVIAANASGDIVRCIGREGEEYLKKLPAEERGNIAEHAFIDNAEYRKRYMDFLEKARKLDEEAKEKSYLAQLSRDNTMAESIYHAWQEYPEAQIIHINGSFHSDFYLGTVAALKARAPQLNIAVIAPISQENPSNPSYSEEDLTKGQYLYLIPEQPEQYVDRSYRQKNHKAMFEKASQKQCH